MDFYILCQNYLPIAIAVAAILISFYFLQRNSKCHNAVQGISEANNENKKSFSGDKAQNKELTLGEVQNSLKGKGLINPEDIDYPLEDERQYILKEMTEQPLTEADQKEQIKEMNVKDASEIQTYYKSSRLGIREIENQMTMEELAEERETQRKQLEEIFKLLETDKDKFGVSSMDDLQAQMKLYTKQ